MLKIIRNVNGALAHFIKIFIIAPNVVSILNLKKIKRDEKKVAS
jgi:hypothetical protein